MIEASFGGQWVSATANGDGPEAYTQAIQFAQDGERFTPHSGQAEYYEDFCAEDTFDCVGDFQTTFSDSSDNRGADAPPGPQFGLSLFLAESAS